VKLVDSAGRTYDADSMATAYANLNANTLIAAINPGNSVQGGIVFDVPDGTQPAGIQVSDSAFTPGTTITLG